jgi:hypothetical protein
MYARPAADTARDSAGQGTAGRPVDARGPVRRIRPRAEAFRGPLLPPLLRVSTVILLAACSGALAHRGTIEQTIGRASFRDIMAEVPEVLRRHGYAIYENRPTASTLYIETGWQERAPFEDEAKGGIEAARTRFIARARKAGPATYSLTISAENQVRAPADTAPDIAVRLATGWSTMSPTHMYEAYVREITTEIRLKVDSGLRTYGSRVDLVPPYGGARSGSPSRAARPSTSSSPVAPAVSGGAPELLHSVPVRDEAQLAPSLANEHRRLALRKAREQSRVALGPEVPHVQRAVRAQPR